MSHVIPRNYVFALLWKQGKDRVPLANGPEAIRPAQSLIGDPPVDRGGAALYSASSYQFVKLRDDPTVH